jgi:hypothetical protein
MGLLVTIEQPYDIPVKSLQFDPGSNIKIVTQSDDMMQITSAKCTLTGSGFSPILVEADAIGFWTQAANMYITLPNIIGKGNLHIVAKKFTGDEIEDIPIGIGMIGNNPTVPVDKGNDIFSGIKDTITTTQTTMKWVLTGLIIIAAIIMLYLLVTKLRG